MLCLGGNGEGWWESGERRRRWWYSEKEWVTAMGREGGRKGSRSNSVCVNV